MLTARWTHHTFKQRCRYVDGCSCFQGFLHPLVTGTFRLSHSCFHFIRDKSKKTWQMVTVPCLILKRLLLRIENGCCRGDEKSSLPANRTISPSFLFHTHTHGCKHSRVHSYTQSTEVSNYTYTHGKKNKKNREKKIKKVGTHTRPHIHTGTWVRDQANVRGK